MDEATRKKLEKADWSRLTLELANYVNYKMKHYFWRTGRGGLLPKGKSCEDIVHETFEKLLSESRTWNEKTFPDLPSTLKGMAHSILSNLSQHSDNKRISSDDVESATDILPETSLLDAERSDAIMRAFDQLISDVHGDTDLERVAQSIKNEQVKAAEIAAATGIDIQKVYQAKRRVKVLLEKIMKRTDDGVSRGM